MERVFFYSDETGHHSGGRYFIVAGIVVAAYHKLIRQQLVEAERISGKGKLDWHGTKDRRDRRRYLELALDIPQLRGRVFFRAYENTQEYWSCTAKALGEAVSLFGREKQCIIAHEGFTHSGREKLKRSVKASGRFEVRAGDFKEPLIRLADCLAGFLALVKFGDPKKADFLGGLDYDWFIDLGKKSPSSPEEGRA